MARVLSTLVKINKGFKIVNHYTDKTTNEVELFENDRVEDLKFVMYQEDGFGEVKTVSGRISGVMIKPIKKAPFKYTLAMFSAPTNELYMCNGFIVDHSAAEESKLTFVSATEVLEYQAESGKEVESVTVEPVLSVELTITLSDDTEVTKTIKVGDELTGVKLMTKNGDTTTDIRVDEFVTTNDNLSNIGVIGVKEVKEDGNTKTIVFSSIKGFEESGSDNG